MKLQDQVTSLEISKKLKELGVKQQSYFVWCQYSPSAPPWTPKQALSINGDLDDWAYEQSTDKWSAFTASELGEMLPEGFSSIKEFGQWKCFHNRFNSKITEFRIGNTEADARGKMLVYLIENKLIDIQK